MMLDTNVTVEVEVEEINVIRNFFNEYDSEVRTITPEEIQNETNVSKYLTSLVSGQYRKSVDEIANTKVGNKIIRKRSLQQVMQESFFYGANRFGNNFIA